MSCDDDPELEVSVKFDDDFILVFWASVSTDDPAEIAAYSAVLTASFLIVCNGRSCGFQIAHNEAVVVGVTEVVLECNGVVMITDPLSLTRTMSLVAGSFPSTKPRLVRGP